MSLFSRSFTLFERLYTRFSIEPGQVSDVPPTLSTELIPVTNVDELLRTPEAATATVDIQASAGAYVPYFTVPEGQSWIVKNLMRFGTTGASAFMVEIGGSSVIITNTGTAGEALILNLRLDQGDSVGLRTTGNAADSAIRADIVRETEDAF